MRVEIHEVISHIYDENKKLVKTKSSENYVIYPDEGKLLRNRHTGLTTDTFIGVGSKDNLSNYEEIDKEE